MTSPLRAVLAAAFFVIIGGVLAIPVLTADEGDVPPRGDRPASTPSEEPTAEPPPTPTPDDSEPTPTEEPEPDPEPVELATTRFADEFPSGCLAEEASDSPGLVASYTRGKVTIATPSGGRRVSIDATPPVSFSASGKWLATGEGLLWGSDGSSVGPLFDAPVSTWAWMPSSDCALGIVGDKLVAATAEGEITAVAEGEITGFAVSPNGRRLALVAGRDESQTISLVDLTAPVEKPPALPFKGTVGGWVSSAAVAIGPPSSGRGASLRAAALAEAASEGALVRLGRVPYEITPEECGSKPVGVVGSGRGANPGHQIAELQATTKARPLTDPSFSYADPSCSSDGDFMVAVRAAAGSGPEDRRLVLLDRSGSFMSSLTSDEQYSDEFPDWGPDGTGVTFVRRPLDGRPAQIWYLAEGAAAARPTGLQVATPVNFRGRFEWRRFVDWSATPPLGVPPF